MVFLSEQQGDPEDGCVLHRSLSCDRKRREQHQACHAGNWLPYSLPRLKQEQLIRKKQSGLHYVLDSTCLNHVLVCPSQVCVHVQLCQVKSKSIQSKERTRTKPMSSPELDFYTPALSISLEGSIIHLYL